MQELSLPKTTWKLGDGNRSEIKRLSRKLNIPEFICSVLLKRGITSIESCHKFLSPSLDQLHEPFLLNDMEKSVNRICSAIKQQQKILICGDYDVDGITSVALLKQCLPRIGAEVLTYLPDRFSDGYGFQENAVDFAAKNNVQLIITVDCGITANATVKYALSFGIDVIITDHHEPGTTLPEAVAVLDPKRRDSTYPDTNLAGVGVAFKLIQALIERKILQIPIQPLLELVALGTVADVAQLTGENRIFVYFGLESLTHTSHPGLRALMKISGLVHGRKLDPVAIGFQLGPRINAVGRLGSPEVALNLLLTHSTTDAEYLADQLNQFNQKRQAIEEKIIKIVDSEVQKINLDQEPFIVVAGKDWHEGVIGIVASKITERYFRPCTVISIKDGIGKGSGRSIPDFNLFESLTEVQDLLIEFGGHQIAAGFRIQADLIPEFTKRCIEIARRKLTADDFIPKTEIDGVLDLAELSFSSLRTLDKLSPFGLGNPKPKFLIRSLKTKFVPRRVGNDGVHLKMILTKGSESISAIAFNFGKYFDLIRAAEFLDIIATPEINIWNQRESLQLHIHDIRICH